jgi:hypothetical protein
MRSQKKRIERPLSGLSAPQRQGPGSFNPMRQCFLRVSGGEDTRSRFTNTPLTENARADEVPAQESLDSVRPRNQVTEFISTARILLLPEDRTSCRLALKVRV